jgi:hypothetical protein
VALTSSAIGISRSFSATSAKVIGSKMETAVANYLVSGFFAKKLNVA